MESLILLQMWTGIVQGVCPINRRTAVKVMYRYYQELNMSHPKPLGTLMITL